ncbi:HAD superfamily hydrolase (TIGR01459 family) [Hoeflea halophila]|uniref:HAD superfamily hydrolase (TIGR01459 family) n=1 Tax=Hoeflea halophila TaxID=714899 RepID=A0A286HMX4_9HYPH|nr:HAD hydrolase-like protein [Hoeflea halophila]SOE08639.1 HAD superfamily hydrolase (TIGR01459 family) [Hoeflea halophila]
MSTGAAILKGADTAVAFGEYESVRHRLPAPRPPSTSVRAEHLDAIAEHFDVFLLDAFGVLNIGESAIPGVVDRVNGLRARGKQVLVVTNAAGYPSSVLHERYRRLGYSFATPDVVSSRMALLKGLKNHANRKWGLVAAPKFGREELPEGAIFLEDDPAAYAEAEGFLMLGASAWSEARQALLEQALRDRPRELLVGNPDLVAPVESGLSREPGHYAHRLASATGVEPVFYGKPFPAIFDLARERIRPGTPDDRVVMVGDTLHTDILGGSAAGFRTALIQGYGFFDGADPDASIAASGIIPDFILDRP